MVLCQAYSCVLLTGQAVFFLDVSLVCGRNEDSVVAATGACHRDKITRLQNLELPFSTFRKPRLFDNREDELVWQAIEAGSRMLSHGRAVMWEDVCREPDASL